MRRKLTENTIEFDGVVEELKQDVAVLQTANSDLRDGFLHVYLANADLEQRIGSLSDTYRRQSKHVAKLKRDLQRQRNEATSWRNRYDYLSSSVPEVPTRASARLREIAAAVADADFTDGDELRF